MVAEKIKSILIVMGLALIALFILVGLYSRSANKDKPSEATNQISSVTVTTSPDTAEAQTEATPLPEQFTPAGGDEIVATVNGTVISGTLWEQATKMDAVLNTLAGYPPPGPEETLDRLINELLIVENNEQVQSFSEADAEARLDNLLVGWQLSEADLSQTLNQAGLSHSALMARIERLLEVEAYINTQIAQGVDVNTWLQQTRAQAEIGLYQPLDSLEQTASSVPVANISDQPAPPTALPAPDIPQRPYPGGLAPDFSLASLTDDEVTLSALRGKPTLLNFWASWCTPCRRELPALEAAYQTYGDDINFFAINVKESRNKIEPFIADRGVTFPVLLDRQGEVTDILYQVRGIPTTLFLDANGVVINRHVGPLEEADIDKYLQPLLAPASTAQTENVGSAEPVEVQVSEPDDSMQAVPESTQAQQAMESAPDFSLNDQNGVTFNLNQALEEGPVALVFYRGHT